MGGTTIDGLFVPRVGRSPLWKMYFIAAIVYLNIEILFMAYHFVGRSVLVCGEVGVVWEESSGRS